MNATTSVWARFETPGRISEAEAHDMRRRWLANAATLGLASPNELREHEGFAVLPPGVRYQAYPARPTRALHVPPCRMLAPAPGRQRSMVCLGCGAPIGGLTACTYCLRRA